jgi:hypothetical protein
MCGTAVANAAVTAPGRMGRARATATRDARAGQNRPCHRSRAADAPVSFLRAGREVMLSAQSGEAKVMPRESLQRTGLAARQNARQ